MRRYYFHLYNDETILDEEGTELPNEAVALQRAATDARTMAAQSVMDGHLVLHHRIEVVDDRGERIGVVHFGNVVEIQE
jgi:hypothetical protein